MTEHLWTEAKIAYNLECGSRNEVRCMLCEISGNTSDSYFHLVSEVIDMSFERGELVGRELAQRELLEAGLGEALIEGNA
jgi:hypothetical protein